MGEPLKNGNGGMRVSLGWLQFIFALATMIGGLILSHRILEVKSDFRYVQHLQEVADRKSADEVHAARLREIELALARAQLDIRTPSITITRRGRDDEGDEDAAR